MKPDSDCSFCGLYKEDYTYLFYACDITQKLFNNVKQFCENTISEPFNLTKESVILASVNANPKSVANLICLVTKRYIYVQRCTAKPLNFMELKAKIVNIEAIEKYIAIKNGNLDKHNKKWHC